MASHRHVARALASAFLVGPWTRSALLRHGELVLGEHAKWLAPVTRATLRHFAAAPTGDDAVDRVAAIIDRNPRFGEAFLDAAPRPTIRRWLAAPPAMEEGPWPVPPLVTLDELAAHLDVDPIRLSWLADAQGWLRRAKSPELHH